MTTAPAPKSLLPQQFYWDTSVSPGKIWAGVPLTVDPSGLALVLDTAWFGAFLPLVGGTLSGALKILSGAADGLTGPKVYIETSVGSATWPGIEMNTNEPGTGAGARGAAGYIASFRLGKSRWTMELGGSDQETGGNTGTNFALRPFNDDGTPQPILFYMDRNRNGYYDGFFAFNTILQVGSGTYNKLQIGAGGDVTQPVSFSTNGSGGIKVGVLTWFSNKLKLSGIPTSATGLTAGDVWRNGTALNIV